MWKKLRNRPVHISNILKMQRRRRKAIPKKFLLTKYDLKKDSTAKK